MTEPVAESSITSEFMARLAEMAVTSELLTSSGDLGQILLRLAQRSRELTGAEFAAISTFDENGVLDRFIYVGMDESIARRLGNPPAGRGLLGELANLERPLRLDDLKQHPASSGWPEGHPDMMRFLGVPIRAGGRTIGSFYMTRIRGDAPFTEQDELAAATLALQAAVSVASAIARERSRRVALLEERERIAHDLHDGTIQALYALGLEHDALASRPDFPDEVRGVLGHSVVRVNELISDIRAYISMLESESPTSQPDLSRDLAFIVRQLVPPGIDTVVNVTAAALQELTAREMEDLLFIAREAVSNAVRHAAPTRLAIDLRQTPDFTALTVQDNGTGFEPEFMRLGLGTVTMRTRAARLRGELTIISIPGMGTTVRVTIPREEATLD